jgi:hypothetical protein
MHSLFSNLHNYAYFGWLGEAAAADDRADCTDTHSKPEDSSLGPSSEDQPKDIIPDKPENATEDNEDQTVGSGSAVDKTDQTHENEVGADSAAKAVPNENEKKPKRLAGRLGPKNESEDQEEGNAPSDSQRRSDAFKVQYGEHNNTFELC